MHWTEVGQLLLLLGLLFGLRVSRSVLRVPNLRRECRVVFKLDKIARGLLLLKFLPSLLAGRFLLPAHEVRGCVWNVRRSQVGRLLLLLGLVFGLHASRSMLRIPNVRRKCRVVLQRDKITHRLLL